MGSKGFKLFCVGKSHTLGTKTISVRQGFYNRKCCLESRLNANFVQFMASFAVAGAKLQCHQLANRFSRCVLL